MYPKGLKCKFIKEFPIVTMWEIRDTIILLKLDDPSKYYKELRYLTKNLNCSNQELTQIVAHSQLEPLGLLGKILYV